MEIQTTQTNKRFITFGSIGQFRNTIKDVEHATKYLGFDEDKQEVIYDRFVAMPTITVTGSEKVHGTNAGVCFSNSLGFWSQSRKNIITPDQDNAGCAFAAYQNESEWMMIIESLAKEHMIDLDLYIISVFYEWSGGNIQKNSALSGLDKRAMIFQYFKVSPLSPVIGNDGAETPESAKWLETSETFDMQGNGPDDIAWLSAPMNNIFNIMTGSIILSSVIKSFKFSGYETGSR